MHQMEAQIEELTGLVHSAMRKQTPSGGATSSSTGATVIGSSGAAAAVIGSSVKGEEALFNGDDDGLDAIADHEVKVSLIAFDVSKM